MLREHVSVYVSLQYFSLFMEDLVHCGFSGPQSDGDQAWCCAACLQTTGLQSYPRKAPNQNTKTPD